MFHDPAYRIPRGKDDLDGDMKGCVYNVEHQPLLPTFKASVAFARLPQLLNQRSQGIQFIFYAFKNDSYG